MAEKYCPIKVREANRGNALKLVQASDKPALVQFYADWCGHCHETRPEVDKASQQLCGQVDVVRVNVDRHSEIADKMGVKGLPTIAMVYKGKVVARGVGAEDADGVMKLAQRGLKKIEQMNGSAPKPRAKRVSRAKKNTAK